MAAKRLQPYATGSSVFARDLARSGMITCEGFAARHGGVEMSEEMSCIAARMAAKRSQGATGLQVDT